jgi:PAS domain S-box-containing protein
MVSSEGGSPVGTLAADIQSRLERQLEVAQQITHIGSWEWDLASGAVTWSDELYRIYGDAPRSRDITLEYFMSRVHPEDRERVMSEVQAAIARRGRFGHRERIIRPDGTVRELDTVGEVIEDARGQPIYLVGTCRDITEERRREEVIRLYADIVDNMQIGLSVWIADDVHDPGSLRLVAYNPATELATGVSLEGAVGRTLPGIFPLAADTELPSLLLAVSPEAPVRELAAYRFGDAPHAPTFAVRAFALPDRAVALALEDITARTRAEHLQEGERRALEMLAAGAPLPDILTVICRYIEELAPPTLASILVLDESGTRLRHGAAPSLPESFVHAIDGSAIGPHAGSCGTAAYLREPVFVADIDRDALWDDYRALADAAGLHACWSMPVLANDGSVLGTFAMYYRQPQVPDEGSIRLIERAAHVAGIAMERRRLDDQMRALHARIESIREDERTGIAREIHDELGQALTALKMDIAWVARRLADTDDVRAKLSEMAGTADEIIQTVRRISAELRPGVLDDLGIEAAIEWQAEEFTRRTGVRCEVRSQLGSLRLERHLATAVFRIFQEALTNVTRHASASHVEVVLRAEGGQLELEVSDDGIGLPESARSTSLGLLGMRERARLLGGDCVVRRRLPRGTTVSLRVPIPERRTDTDKPMGT